MFKLIDLPRVFDPRGNLTYLQYPDQIPFEIKRIFWTYDVPGGEKRGGHAFKNQNEIIVALSGSFDVVISLVNGDRERISLNRSYTGLFISPLTWRHMENFSTNSLALHLVNTTFDKTDYLYNLDDFKKYLTNDRI